MSATMKETFWKNMDNVKVVLLGAGGGSPVPMAPIAREDDNDIWFITSADHDTFKAAKGGESADIYLCDSAGHMYGSMKGTLSVSDDTDKLDEVWSPMAGAWFENGREDDLVRLMKYTPREAEIWANESTAKYLFETIKANVTKDTPDSGEYGMIHF